MSMPANHLCHYALLTMQCSMVYWSIRVSSLCQTRFSWYQIMEFLLLVFTLDLSGLLQKFLLECSSLSSDLEFITVRVFALCFLASVLENCGPPFFWCSFAVYCKVSVSRSMVLIMVLQCVFTSECDVNRFRHYIFVYILLSLVSDCNCNMCSAEHYKFEKKANEYQCSYIYYACVSFSF